MITVKYKCLMQLSISVPDVMEIKSAKSLSFEATNVALNLLLELDKNSNEESGSAAKL